MCRSCLNHIQDTKQSIDYKGHKICVPCLINDDVDKQGLKYHIDRQVEDEEYEEG